MLHSDLSELASPFHYVKRLYYLLVVDATCDIAAGFRIIAFSFLVLCLVPLIRLSFYEFQRTDLHLPIDTFEVSSSLQNTLHLEMSVVFFLSELRRLD